MSTGKPITEHSDAILFSSQINEKLMELNLQSTVKIGAPRRIHGGVTGACSKRVKALTFETLFSNSSSQSPSTSDFKECFDSREAIPVSASVCETSHRQHLPTMGPLNQDVRTLLPTILSPIYRQSQAHSHEMTIEVRKFHPSCQNRDTSPGE